MRAVPGLGRKKLSGVLLLRSLVILSLWFLLSTSFFSRGFALEVFDPRVDPPEEILGEIPPWKWGEGIYYTLEDEEGSLLLETGRRIRKGDEFLSVENRLYRVFEVEEYRARARLEEEVELPFPQARLSSPEFSRAGDSAAEYPGLPLLPFYYSRVRAIAGEEEDWAQQEPSRLIGIYHTHNAESYIPSDGAADIYGKGGIHRVGEAFKETFEERGINVIHNEQLHLPHDRGAYRRSRSTALNLLARGPDAIFDVHRDAAPAQAYEAGVAGRDISQILIVVGRSNPNLAVNRNFAYELKGYADRIYPGLVKGIFMAFGSYNQELSPMNLLLEAGGYQNTRESAERGISLFCQRNRWGGDFPKKAPYSWQEAMEKLKGDAAVIRQKNRKSCMIE